MPDETAFWLAIAADPDDDRPRLVYADWLEEQGDPRGEFVRVQIELARSDGADDRRTQLRWREAALLAEHRADWLGPWRHERPDRWAFHRGVLEVRCRPATFLSRTETLTTAALPWYLDMSEDPFAGSAMNALDRAAECGWVVGAGITVEARVFYTLLSEGLRLVRRLGLAGSVTLFLADLLPKLTGLSALELGEGAGDESLAALASSPALSRVRSLGVASNTVSDRGVHTLTRSLHLGRLTELSLRGDHLTDMAVWSVAESNRLGTLTALRLHSPHLTADGLSVLTSAAHLGQLTELDLRDCPGLGNERSVRALGGAPGLPRLRRINLGGAAPQSPAGNDPPG
jgi:uncharacterized protein (TIGR02996 family)